MPESFIVPSHTHAASLISTGVDQRRALLSPREWRRRTARQQQQQQPRKPKPTTARGFARTTTDA